MNYSTNVAPSLFATQLNDNVCYRDADGAIDGLAACSTKSFQMRCAGKAEGLIHDGFCYNSNVTQFDARVAVFTFLTEPKKKVQTIPSIRTVVQLQWLAVALGLTRDRRRRTYQTGLGALGSSGYMYFAPASADTTALVSWLNSSEPMFQAVYGGTFATLGEAHARVTGLVSEGRNWAIVNVDAVTATKFDVRIGINASAIPLTEFILSEFYFGGPGQESNSLYLMSGFLSIQEALNRYYRTQILNVAQAPPTPALLPMPYPGYTDNVFLITTRQLIPLVIVLGFMYPVSQMTKLIVIEKELRIREAMMIMGLGSSSFYLSWFVTYGIQNVFVSLICGALLKATYLNDSSYAIIFFCFFLFSCPTSRWLGL
jgi:hypothetical protein